jgi:hypothetical protein
MRRFLKEEGEKGSCAPGELEGNNAEVMSRVRNSSLSRDDCGSWIVFWTGVLGEEKKLKREVLLVAVLDDGGFVGVELFMLFEESKVESVGRFFSFAAGRSGDASREDIVDGLEDSCSPTGMPTDTGADEPVNHELRPPLDLSATLIVPSLSPVSVGMKSASSLLFSFVGDRCGLVEFVRVRGVRKGRRAVRER